jgi:hypothetical protein
MRASLASSRSPPGRGAGPIPVAPSRRTSPEGARRRSAGPPAPAQASPPPGGRARARQDHGTVTDLDLGTGDRRRWAPHRHHGRMPGAADNPSATPSRW